MGSRTKYLFKNTILFGISNFASRLIAFFLIPIYTYKLTASEYGTADLLYTVASFVYPIISLNIAEAIFRFSMDKKNRKSDISTISLICIAISIVFGALIFMALKAFHIHDEYSWIFSLYLVTLSVSQILLATLKGQEKLTLFTLGNIVNSSLIAAFSILFIQIKDMKIDGFFLSYVLANIIVSLFVVIVGKLYKGNKLSFNKTLFVEMIRYSTVLIPTSFLWWITNSSDRIMVANMISPTANGLYAISYKLPSILTVLASIFNQAWVFSAIKEKNNKDKNAYSNKVFGLLLFTLILFSLFILLTLKPLLTILVSSEYYESWKYVPFLLFGFIFMTLATFLSSSYNVHKDSKGFLVSAAIGAILNIILNFLFIPTLSVYGAALATMISYITVFAYRLIDTKKYTPIAITKRAYASITILIIASLASYFNGYAGPLAQIVCIAAIIIINKNHIPILLGVFKKIKPRN